MSDEKQSKLKKFIGKFSKKPQTSGIFSMPPENEPVALETSGEADQEKPEVEEEKPVMTASSPFASGAKITPIGEPYEFSANSTAPQTGQEIGKPRNATDEIMGMLAKVEPQTPNKKEPLDVHEVTMDMKTDIGWEADLEKAAGMILTMTPEQFLETYHKDIKYAKIAARYNMIEIINDVLENGNRAHAFDRVVEMARNILKAGHHEQLVVVGEFTYIVDKKG